MDKLAKYRECVQSLLTRYAEEDVDATHLNFGNQSTEVAPDSETKLPFALAFHFPKLKCHTKGIFLFL